MPLRPTPDAMRERAFAVLAGRVPGARCLDLFAGTGAVGLEALSRGALSTVFVDHHRAAIALITANRDTLGLATDRAVILHLKATTAISRLARQHAIFDLVWADPPFDTWTDGLNALTQVVDHGLLAPGGLMCLECPSRTDDNRISHHFTVERDLTGGASRVILLSPLKP
jgi:16S rRNA (guanine966-N2)-methyltransferase